MSQYEFDKLVEKYLAGEGNSDEEKRMREWTAHRLNQSQIQLSEIEKKAIKKRIWTRIRSHTVRQQPFLTHYGWPTVGLVAASILLVLAGFFVWQRPDKDRFVKLVSPQDSRLEDTLRVQNISDKICRITLKDGSLVWLSAGSQLSYPKTFGNKNRSVYLQGEAFFDVKRDAARPFIVHTGNLVTQVLGTSFTVKSSAETIEVVVVRGRVSVYETSDKSALGLNGVILVPNQKITFDKVSQKLTPGLIEIPQLLQPAASKPAFMFDRTSVGQVLTTLRKAYGIDIIVENQAINHCIFNGDLNDLTLYEQLDLICKSLNATYERRGTTLFIQGEGCAE